MSTTPDTFASLCDLYLAYQTEQGLQLGSADEVDHDQLTPEQSDWVHAFVARWDAMARAERDDRRRFRTSEHDGKALSSTLAEMIRANHEDGELCDRLRSMQDGDQINAGGGAAALVWIVCASE